MNSSHGPGLSPENPWPGLGAFTEQDSAYFHGRDAEAAELARLVRREPLTVLFGRSGLGKTSLLGAGLFPRLREDSYFPVLVRLCYATPTPLSAQVQGALLAACAAHGVEGPPPLPDASMWEFFQRAGAAFWNARNRPVTPVLVLDQFEEIFTLGQEDEGARRRSDAFLEELGDLIENRPPPAIRQALDADPEAIAGFDFQRRGCKVVLSFREDFLAEMEGLKRRIPSLMRNRYRLQPMNGAQAYEVVTASGGHLVGEDVAPRIVGLAWRNMAEPPPDPDEYPRMEIDPALLSVICSELNLKRQRAGRAHITADLLAGAEREILTDFYERSFEGLDPRVRVFVEDELITDRGYRDSFVLEDAVALPGLSQPAIDQLVDRRLLRVDDRLGLRRLELTHDVLTKVVKDSRDSRKAREAEVAALARERAAAEQQRKNRRNTRLVAVGAGLAILLLGSAGWSWYRADTASKVAAVATSHAEQALKKAEEERNRADKSTEELKAEKANVAKAQKNLREVAEQAGEATTKAEEAKREARKLIEEAKATDLIISARTVRGDALDLALLLGAEATRKYETRVEGQVDLLGLLLANSQLAVLLRTEAAQTSYAFSPNGKALAVGTEDGRVTLWSTDTWQVSRSLQTDSGPVTAVAFSRDGARLATAGARSIALWRLPKGDGAGEELARLKDLNESPARLVFSPDGASIAVESSRGTVDLWRVASENTNSIQNVVYRPRRGQGEQKVSCLAFGADGATLTAGLTVGKSSGAVVKWDVAAGQPLPSDPKFDDVLGFSPGCELVAVRHRSEPGPETIQVREFSGAKLPADIAQERGVRAVRFSPDGRFLAIAEYGREGMIHVYDARTASSGRLGSISIDGGGRVDNLSFSPDGKVLAMALEDGTLIARDWNSGTLRLKAGTSRGIGGMIFSPDGRMLVALPGRGGIDRLNAVWSLERGEVLIKPDGTPHVSEEVEFNHGGEILASVGKEGNRAYFWNGATKALLRSDNDFIQAEFSPDGTKLAIARSTRNVVQISDASGEKPEAEIDLKDQSRVTSLAFSWDKHNRQLAIGFDDGSVAIYDLKTKPPTPLLQPTKQHAGGEAQVAFSPAGTTLASAGADGRVVLWNGTEGWKPAETESKSKHVARILRLAFSPDGKLLAAGDKDGTVVLYAVDNRKRVGEFVPHDDSIKNVGSDPLSVVFVEGGRALVWGPAKEGARDVWDVPGRRWLTTLHNPGGNSGSLALSPQGRRIALRHDDGQVTLRDWETSTLVRDACRIANRNLTCVEWRQYIRDRTYRKTCKALPGPAETCQ